MNAGFYVSCTFAVFHINQVDSATRTLNQCIGDGSFCSAANLDYILHTVYVIGSVGSIIHDSHVFYLKVRLTQVIRIQTVHVTVGFDAARIGFRTCVVSFPNAIAVLQRTAIALCEVEHIVIRINSQQVGYIYCSAKELDCIVGTFQYVDIFNLCSVADTVQGQSVVFDVCCGACTRIADFHVSQ